MAQRTGKRSASEAVAGAFITSTLQTCGRLINSPAASGRSAAANGGGVQ
jgi:hypothetical protein